LSSPMRISFTFVNIHTWFTPEPWQKYTPALPPLF
jgi:hypothetical protein